MELSVSRYHFLGVLSYLDAVLLFFRDTTAIMSIWMYDIIIAINKSNQ